MLTIPCNTTSLHAANTLRQKSILQERRKAWSATKSKDLERRCAVHHVLAMLHDRACQKVLSHLPYTRSDIDMFGPGSLRSHQPSKTTLKTYGSRGKRSSTSGAPTGATKLFQWDRLESERKTRSEQREQTRLDEKLHEDPATTEVDHDIQSYSDSDPDDILRAVESKLASTTRQSRRSSTESRSWSTLDHINSEPSVRGLRGGLEPPQAHRTAPSLKPQPSSASGRQETTTSRLIHQAMFREKPIFEENQEEEDEDHSGDEVLFRTPSFHVLQRLKELPKPRPIEPRVNPFGFDVLPEAGSSRGKGANGGMASSNSSINAPSDAVTKSTLLESPTTKRSLEILNRRAQQLVDLQRHREQSTHLGRALPNDETSMEIDPEYQKVPLNNSRNGVDNRISNVVSMKHCGPTRIQNAPPPPFPQDNFDSAPDPEVGRRQVVQDDCVDLALGKRMSNIQITPQRLQAKQRKTHSHDSVALPVPLASSFLADFENDPFAELPPKSANLFLDRDIPKDEEDDFDKLFRRARQNRKRSPLPSSPPTLSTSHKAEDRSVSSGVLPRNERTSSALQLPTRHTPTFARTASSRLLHRQDSTGIYRSDSFEDLHSPFIDISTYNSKQETRQAATPRIPSQKPVPSQLVIQHQYNRFNHPQQQQPQQPRVTKPSIQSLGPHQQPSPDGPTQPQPPPRPIRQIRSLKRPPAPLVSSRKSIFRPTVDDLLAISDQRFFDQFRALDQGLGGGEGVDGRGRDSEQCKDERPKILNFETLLPECMTDGLTKIGEASYSEVYTVELPIAQLRKQKQRPGRPSKNQRDSLFEPFQSSRLNDYVKDFMEDMHRQTSSRDKTDRKRDVGTAAGVAKLVMKVMPFLYGESAEATTHSEGSGRGRRMKGRRKPESSLLAVEDIYREAMVSTQIMQHWKGFISGFG